MGQRVRVILLFLLPLAAVVIVVATNLAGEGPSTNGPPTSQATLAVIEIPQIPGEETRVAALGSEGLIVQGTDAGQVRVLPRPDGPALHEFATDGTPISAVAISKQESMVAAATLGGSLWTWDLSSGRTSTVPTSGEWTAIALSPNGELLAAAAFDVSIFDISMQELAFSFEQPLEEGGIGTYNAVAFSNDSNVVAAVGSGGAHSWNLSSGDFAGPIVECACSGAVALSLDATSAVFGTADGHVVLWDLTTGRQTADGTVVVPSEESSGGVTAVAVTETGDRIVAATSSGEVLFWDPVSRTTASKGKLAETPVVMTDVTEDGSRVLASVQVDELPPSRTPCDYTGCAVHHRFYLLE